MHAFSRRGKLSPLLSNVVPCKTHSPQLIRTEAARSEDRLSEQVRWPIHFSLGSQSEEAAGDEGGSEL